MKTICFLLLIASSLSYGQDSDPAVSRALERIRMSRAIGGAGNGGGELAIDVARDIGLKARELGVGDLRSFRGRFSVLVGNFTFCCEVGAKYFASDRVVLVDRHSWMALTAEDRDHLLENLVRKIENSK